MCTHNYSDIIPEYKCIYYIAAYKYLEVVAKFVFYLNQFTKTAECNLDLVVI